MSTKINPNISNTSNTTNTPNTTTSYEVNDIAECEKIYNECFNKYFIDQNQSSNKCYLLYKQCKKYLKIYS